MMDSPLIKELLGVVSIIIMLIYTGYQTIRKYRIQKRAIDTIIHLSSHELKNLLENYAKCVKEDVLCIFSEKESKKNKIRYNTQMAKIKINRIINKEIDSYEKSPITNLPLYEIKKTVTNALISTMIATNMKLYERLDENHFDKIENWEGWLTDKVEDGATFFEETFFESISISLYVPTFFNVDDSIGAIIREAIKSGFEECRKIAIKEAKKREKIQAKEGSFVPELVKRENNEKDKEKEIILKEIK